MRIDKCDICKKTLNDGELGVSLSGKRFQKFDLCFICGDPVMKFLKTKKLVKDKIK